MTTYQRGDEETSPVVEASDTDQTLEQLAEQLGERPGVLTAKLDITKVLEQMDQVVLVNLRIEGPRRFAKKITPQDLGLSLVQDKKKVGGVLSDEASEVLENFFHLGSLSLLPSRKHIDKLLEKLPKELTEEERKKERDKYVSHEELKSLERSARYCLDRYSLKSHWGAFVPVTAYQKWKEENALYEKEFVKLRDRLVENYDLIVKETLK